MQKQKTVSETYDFKANNKKIEIILPTFLDFWRVQ